MPEQPRAANRHVKHGSETFFIEGEGLLSTQVGGRTGAETDPAHRARHAAPRQVAGDHRTTLPLLPRRTEGPSPQRDRITRKLARAMVVGGGGAGNIPAGYTYLGQFVDHDLTMDQTDVMLGEDVSPAELLQGRSPRLDLDSLYGAGPGDAASAKFYEADGLHLKTGTTIPAENVAAQPGHDLPRNGTGSGPAARRRALIPDPRNDENLIVAQTHLAMINFHNKVADRVTAHQPEAQRFIRTRKLVTLHYQWMLRHDYLPRIARPAIVNDVWRQRAAGWSSPMRHPPTYRRCRSSSPSRPSDSATA